MERLKPVLLMILIVPPMALAGISGVGTFETSTRSTLPLALKPRSNVRVPSCEEAISDPFAMTIVPVAGIPRIPADCGVCGL